MDEALLNQAEVVKIFSTNDRLKLSGDAQCQMVSQKEMASISTLSSPSEVLAVVRIPEIELTSFNLANSKVIALDDIKDPGNLGTIIRNADWFGIKSIIVSPETVDEFNPKVVQSTMGSLFRVHVYRTELPTLLLELKDQGAAVFSAEMSGETSSILESHGGPGVLIIGSESHGVSKEVSSIADKKVSISGMGNAESLNAAVATGILLYSWTKG